MEDGSKPPVTGGSHTLPFEKLAPLEFERLCLWLVQREGYQQAEHLGEAGSEGGRDVLAWKEGRRVVFQCKRVKTFTAAHARAEISKLRRLPAEAQPHELVFVVSQAVSADARAAARAAWGSEATCHFWAGGELDERVKKHADLLEEFFQLPGRSWVNRGVGLLLLGVVLALLGVLWLLPSDRGADDVKRMLLVARDAKEHPLGGFRFAYQSFKSLPTSDTGATELELPPKHRPGKQITILLASAPSQEEDWFLINPLVNVPEISGSADVVLMQRSEFRALAAEAVDVLSQLRPGPGGPTIEQRMRALLEVADHHGLTEDQLDAAIRSFGDTQDPSDKGVSAYLKGQFLESEVRFEDALEKHESDFVKPLPDLGGAAGGAARDDVRELVGREPPHRRERPQ